MKLEEICRIEGVSLVSVGGDHPPPYVGIVGSIHGNELCGLDVLQGLADADNPLRRRLARGTLVLIHGNPEATLQGRRCSQGGFDLNRLFDFTWLRTLPEEAWSYEHHRAMALKPVVDQLDAVLDLHSSTLPTEPFIITQPVQLPLARRLGCRWITYGWDGPGLLADKVLTGAVHRRGRPAFSVECGQHFSTDSVTVAWQVTERYLTLMGLLDGEAPLDAEPTVLQVVHRVGKPTLNFSFSRPFAGFDQVVSGDLLGEGDGVRLTVDEEYRVLLPNSNVPVGEDMLYLGRVRNGDANGSAARADH